MSLHMDFFFLLKAFLTTLYSGTSCVWAVNRLGFVAEAELLKLSSYGVIESCSG